MNTPIDKMRSTRVLFWTLATALLFYKLGATAPWQSEDRWLQIAREMVDSGNFFKPTINGKIYFDKPLLSYWLELLAALVTGGVNEWAMRLPSALAALVTLWATVDLGCRLWSEKTGALAGWILLTGFGFLQWGRLGEADMENLAVTIVAVNWYWRRRDAPDFFGYLVFYLLVAVGAQCKGLTAVIVPLIALLPDMLVNKRWRLHINNAHIFAVLIACGIYLLPFFLATSTTTSTVTTAGHSSGLGLVIRENVLRYFAPFDHTGPVYTYLVTIPQFLFPWAPVFIAALLACGWKKFRIEPNVGWTLWTLALIFLFFSVSGSRRSYYILPILPYCALLSARFLHDVGFARLRQWALHITLLLLVILGLLQAITPLLWSQLEQHLGETLPNDLKWLCFSIGLTSLCYISVTLWCCRHRNDVTIAAICGAGIILWGSLFFWQQPAMDRYRTEAPFARDLKQLGADIAANGAAIYRNQATGRLLYYSSLPLPVQQINDPEQLQQFIATPPYPKLVVVNTTYKNEFPVSLRNQPPDLVEQHYGWEKNIGEKMLAWRITQKPE